MKQICLLILLAILCLQAPAFGHGTKWFRGNLHCHTNRVDGDATPEEVALWYRAHRYHFLVISDHNVMTDPRELRHLVNEGFILIPGEEVSNDFGKKSLHVNGIGITRTIRPLKGKSVEQILQYDIDMIRGAGGLPMLNHPNRLYSFDESTILKLRDVKLMEIYNFNNDNHNFPAGGRRGMEEMWDAILSAGMRMYGTASDDAHRFKGEFSVDKPIPGKAWVVARAPALTVKDIMNSLAAGDFYATNGVHLKDLVVTEKTYTVEIEQIRDHTYTTFFKGRNGRVLKKVDGTKASYTFEEKDLYVRAKIMASSGEFAITQPYFIR